MVTVPSVSEAEAWMVTLAGAAKTVPDAGLVMVGNTLYGTTQAANEYGDGTVFALVVPGAGIPLNIALNSGKVTLTWGSPAFSLQSATNLAGVFTNIPGATSPYTNAITSKQQFFRLQEN